MAHATRRDFETAFAGLDFPASKSAVLNRARDNGGIDREVETVLSQLPDEPFDSLEELEDAVRAIYLSEGTPPEELPL